MDPFSKSKPDLINRKAVKHIKKVFNSGSETIPSWGDNVHHFYTNYIRPNIFALIILLIVILFLTIRYFIKQHRVDNNKRKKQSKSKSKKRKKTKSKKREQIEQVEQDEIHDTIDVLPELISEPDYDQNDNYDDQISEEMLKEHGDKMSAKLTFDELAKIMCGGN